MITTKTDGAPVGGYELPMYNRQGVRISLDEWAMLMSEGRSAADPTAGYHRIGYDTIGPFTISTAWTGLDSRAYIGGEPLIFETAVMLPHHPDQWFRHATEADALDVHTRIVGKARASLSVGEALRNMLFGDDA